MKRKKKSVFVVHKDLLKDFYSKSLNPGFRVPEFTILVVVFCCKGRTVFLCFFLEYITMPKTKLAHPIKTTNATMP